MTIFYMFSSKMKNMIFENINNTRVVTINIHSTLLNAIVTKHLFHPKEFNTTPCGNIFCFHSGQGYQISLLT